MMYHKQRNPGELAIGLQLPPFKQGLGSHSETARFGVSENQARKKKTAAGLRSRLVVEEAVENVG